MLKYKTFVIFTLIVPVLLLCLMLSCTKTSNIEDRSTIIRLSPASDKQPMSKFIDSVKYIRLAAPRNISIGMIQSVVFFDEHYYVLHTPTMPSLTVFDINGRFVRNIGKFGRGPGEYLFINDFAINHDDKMVVLMDDNAQRMHYYTLEGDHIDSKVLPLSAECIYYMDGSYVFWMANLYDRVLNADVKKRFNIFVLDRDYNTTHGFLEVSNEFMGVMHGSLPSSFSPYGGGVNVVAPLSNDIYHYKDGSLFKKYYLDFGPLNCDFLSELRKDQGDKGTFVFRLRNTGATYYPNQFFEFKNYMFFTFLSDNKMYSVFYDKKNETSHVSFEYPEDDIHDAIFGRAVGKTETSLISVIEPLLLMDEEENFPAKLDFLNLTPNSRPVLTIYKMR
ncbi:6-bladed beta-propeller [Natronoflexus pectinivorans]|uniref:6-bladed beta-propeller protein n=1 Tax=Natronoflexus pectinivorans TaxID=682526 RepID=A0A4V2RVI3_9BACT|nr:6-bladed beta-propeller [Natronoflexus pectinivorans]TCO04414.1 6-bladed beta-propeller protein [Natronoflexus pectinivorans]